VGQVVVGIVTDIDWPSSFRNLSVSVYKGSSATGQRTTVTPPEVILLSTSMGLPGTYVVSSDTPVWTRVEISALDAGGSPLVTRAAVFLIEPGAVRFVRLGLVKSCVNFPCGTDQTCVEGKCLTPAVAPDDVITYNPIDATTLECQSSSQMLVTADDTLMMARGTCPIDRTCVEGSCRLTQGP
jgi:hypothetical protein